MAMSEIKKAQEQYNFVYDVVKSAFNQIARSAGLIVSQVAIVASYDATTKKATVFFPSDMSTPSNPYKNMTGEDLVVGQKVYIFYKYGDLEQGWIMIK
jgi:hypothetical protein